MKYGTLSIYPQAGTDPLFAESAQSNEWESDALTNQATMAGYVLRFLVPIRGIRIIHKFHYFYKN